VVASQAAPPPQAHASIPGDIIVGFKPGVSQDEQEAVLGRAGAARTRSWGFINAALAHVPDARRDALIKQLQLDPRVRYAEPNYIVHVDATPNDPSFGQLYGLNNTGQTIQGGAGTADADIDAPEAWDHTTGSSNVVVAVVDTGVDYTHPDLAANMWVNPGENCGSTDPTIVCAQRTNGIDDDPPNPAYPNYPNAGNGYVDDVYGYDFVNHDGDPMDDMATVYHGTHVSGTIGGVGNNGVGVAGVNWHVKVMALKFLNSSGSGSTSDAVTAFAYAKLMHANLTSNSWGGGGFSQALLDAINANGAAGILTVAAAGNASADDDSAPPYPAGYDTRYVLAVAATDNNDALASFSSYGRHTVMLGAPGVNIYSTMAGGGYQYLSGTSMATPHVAGAAALLLSVFPTLQPKAIAAILGRTADPKPAVDGNTISGGRLNANNAVTCSGPKLEFVTPHDGDAAGVGQQVPIDLLAGDCGSTLTSVTVTANGSPVTLTNAGGGEWTGTYTPSATGTVTFHAAAGDAALKTDTRDAAVTVAQNYSCGPTAYAPIDATSGTNLNLPFDDNFTTVALPFAFTFYGQSQSSITVSTNGFVNFGSTGGSSQYVNGGLPSAGLPNAGLYPFWDDLYPVTTGAIYSGTTGNTPNRTFTVEWAGVPHFGGGTGTVTFEVNLHETTNTIDFQYVDTDFGDATLNNGLSATSGVENASGTLGVQNSFNQATLTSGSAVACQLPSGAAPTILTGSAVDGTTTVQYSQTFTGSGGTGSYSWTKSAGTFPPGLTLNSGTPSATLSGIPTTVGTYNFTLQLADANSQSTTHSYTVVVATPVSVTTSSLPTGVAGSAYNSGPLGASGGTGTYGWAWSGSTPPWASISGSTGAITGTPPNAGSWTFTVTASDTGAPPRTGSRSLTLTVNGPTITITTGATLPAGKVNVAYSQTLSATGGNPASYSWSRTGGTVPPGLQLHANGALDGAPTKPGNYSFTARVTDDTNTASKTFSLRVSRK
jgi:subtilisin family serine protease